jgi:hypothetical protein
MKVVCLLFSNSFFGMEALVDAMPTNARNADGAEQRTTALGKVASLEARLHGFVGCWDVARLPANRTDGRLKRCLDRHVSGNDR